MDPLGNIPLMIPSLLQSSRETHPLDLRTAIASQIIFLKNKGYWRDLAALSPRGIPNIGNACYRNASNQALFAFPSIIRKLFHPETSALPVPISEKYQQTCHALQQLFLSLFPSCNNFEDVDPPDVSERLWLETLVRTGVCSDINLRTKMRQHDAAGYSEAVLSEVLDETFILSRKLTAKNDGKKSESVCKELGHGMLHLPLKKNLTSLQELINDYFSVNLIEDEQNPWRPEGADGESLFLTKYQESFRVLGKPKDMLPIQIGRFGYGEDSGAYRDATALEIPENNIVDFSKAYGRKPGRLMYRLKSFVCHHGSTPHSGHYTAYVQRGGIWYHCNDECITPLIGKKKASIVNDAKKTAYLLYFERMDKTFSLISSTLR
ncbi:MAG: ubiquitin carboxyl-terminal hydrolase family protein [Parachlamydiaceae bacterium]